MYVIRVVPLVALPPNVPQTLDYFWPTPLLRGVIVRAWLGRRIVIAVVMASTDVRHSKLAVKRAGYELKKLNGVITELPQLTEPQLALAEWLSQQYAAGAATSMRSVAPPFIGKRGSSLVIPRSEVSGASSASVRLMLTGPGQARAEIERVLASAGSGQVALIVPEIALAERFSSFLAAYHPLIVHSDLSSKALLNAHRSVCSGDARLIIGTRGALALPWKSLAVVIMEDPQHEAYKSERAPRMNAADVAREVARLNGAQCIYLAPSLTVVQRYLADRHVLDVTDQRKASPRIDVVSITEEQRNGNRSLLSRTAQSALEQAVESRRPVLVYSSRRAYATAIRCRSCEAAVMCTTCGIPMRLHRTSEDMLVCYHCSAFIRVPRMCPTCATGTLRAAGLAGSQRLAEAVERITGERPPVLDSDLVKSTSDARGIWHAFEDMRTPVLVATQMVFAYRYERTFKTIIVPHADTLGSDADFRASERATWRFEKLLDFSPETMIVQAWEPSAVAILSDPGARDSWFRNELDDRRALGWPPFTRLVKCTVAGRIRTRTSRDATVAAERLRQAVSHERLAGTEIIGPVPSLLEHANGIWSHHILIKTSLSGRSLAQFLRYVPPHVVVDVDPRSIA